MRCSSTGLASLSFCTSSSAPLTSRTTARHALISRTREQPLVLRKKTAKVSEDTERSMGQRRYHAALLCCRADASLRHRRLRLLARLGRGWVRLQGFALAFSSSRHHGAGPEREPLPD